jgi:hypothetical protein
MLGKSNSEPGIVKAWHLDATWKATLWSDIESPAGHDAGDERYLHAGSQ